MKLTSVEGRKGEELAVKFLKKKGYAIIDRNFHSYTGEIDIVAREGGYIVFLEVKERSDEFFGHPLETITRVKIKKIVRTAQAYLMMKNLYGIPARFDVVAILGNKCELYKNAFEIN